MALDETGKLEQHRVGCTQCSWRGRADTEMEAKLLGEVHQLRHENDDLNAVLGQLLRGSIGGMAQDFGCSKEVIARIIARK